MVEKYFLGRPKLPTTGAVHRRARPDEILMRGGVPGEGLIDGFDALLLQPFEMILHLLKPFG